MANETCVLCGEEAEVCLKDENPTKREVSIVYTNKCERCGTFHYSALQALNINSEKKTIYIEDIGHYPLYKLSCLTREYFEKGIEVHICINQFERERYDNDSILSIPIEDLIKQYPKDHKEIVYRVLNNIYRKSIDILQPVGLNLKKDYPLLFADSPFYGKSVINNNLLAPYLIIKKHHIESMAPFINISEKGYDLLFENKAYEKDQIFIAMPFTDHFRKEVLEDLFEKAIDLIEVNGNALLPAVVDREDTIRDHKGTIDDLIVQRIKESKIILADLTCGRNGVYWEAGYAEGLGKPVVYTVEESELDEVHFDLNHRPLILRKIETDDDRRKYINQLAARIAANIPNSSVKQL